MVRNCNLFSLLSCKCGLTLFVVSASSGGINGRVYGSPNFRDGERIDTSEIVSGVIDNYKVVKTSSGSRYFLSDDISAFKEKKAGAGKALQDLLSARPGSTITLTRERKEQAQKAAVAAVEKTPARSTFSLFGLFGDNEERSEEEETQPAGIFGLGAGAKTAPAPTPKPAPKKAPKPAPKKVPKPTPKKAPKPAPKPAPKAAPSPSTSIFGGLGGTSPKAAPKAPAPTPAPKASGFGFGAPKAAPKPKPAAKKAAPKPKPAPKKATAPPGVPTLSRWRSNGDGSITGFITGSKSFRDGERVTTSPIARGRIDSGEVVTTGSGSRYFLA
jgi:hypothetical protein